MKEDYIIKIYDETDKGLFVAKEVIVGKEYPIYKSTVVPDEIEEYAKVLEILYNKEEFLISSIKHAQGYIDTYVIPVRCRVEITRGFRKGFITQRNILKLN